MYTFCSFARRHRRISNTVVNLLWVAWLQKHINKVSPQRCCERVKILKILASTVSTTCFRLKPTSRDKNRNPEHPTFILQGVQITQKRSNLPGFTVPGGSLFPGGKPKLLHRLYFKRNFTYTCKKRLKHASIHCKTCNWYKLCDKYYVCVILDIKIYLILSII